MSVPSGVGAYESGGNLDAIKQLLQLGSTVIVQTTSLFTTAQSAVGSGNSGDLNVSTLREISIDITMTLITTNLQFFWERKGADGIYYPLWQTAVLTSTTNPVSTSVGPGCAYNQSLGTTGRFRWVATGNASFTPNVYGK